MIQKIYLDMDGVLADFHSRYIELFSSTPKDSRDNKLFSPQWKEFVKTEQFKTLDWWKDGEYFLDNIRLLQLQYGFDVEILSSSGGERYHDLVVKQKLFWLNEKGITYNANIVSGRKKKKEYAASNNILVDDTEDVIDDFNAAGGIGLLHVDADETLTKIKLHLQ
jgi:5'(3')-deoxyribonucleotidase